MEDLPDLAEVTRRRLDFLETMAGTPLRKHELVDELDCSRSTVNRAIDELEAESLVTRETDGYRTTLTGHLIATSYRRFLSTTRDVDAARDVLSPLGVDVELPPALLQQADAYRTSGPDPYRPLERLDAAVVDADTIEAALPSLPYPRLLDRCRSTAVGGAVTLVLGDALYRHARTRFPADVAALARQDGVEIRAANEVNVGLVVVDDLVVTLVFDDEGRLHGSIESTDPAAVTWARDRIGSLAVAGSDVVEEFTGLTTAVEGRAAGGGHRIVGTNHAGGGGDDELIRTVGSSNRGTLASQGFTTLSDDRLTGDPDPVGPLRAPPSFPEVAAGYVLDRTEPDGRGRYSIADRLFEGLTRGRDRSLVGPAGSGKSTICRAVAVRWHRSGRGPVLYRRGSPEEPFTAVEGLHERVSNADGHVLVVVEDAVTEGAARTMAVARGLADRSDVSFLFDARRDTYDDPDGLPLAPADLAYRRRIETVRMPRLDEPEVERFIDHVAGVTGTTPAADPAAMLDELRGRDAPGTVDDRGEVSRLVHRLAYATVRSEGDVGVRSSLEAEIDRAIDELDERPHPTMDVAILINLLNVAGVEDATTLAYAVADGEDDEQGGSTVTSGTAPPAGTRTDPEAVRRALDRLEGSVLLSGSDASRRTVHEEWSVLFLERLLDREPDPVVARRVGRVASVLLSLADDPPRRSRIRRELGGDAPSIDAIESDPVSWAAATTAAVYDVGRSYPRLAGLYGRVRYSWIDLPDACPDGLRARPPEWITRMYIDAGDLDRATAALDAWQPGSATEEAKRQRGFGDVARRRGEYDAAMDHFDRAVELFERAGDREGLAAAVRGRGQAAHFAGEFETAYEAGSQAYAVAASLEDPIPVAKSLMNVANALDAMGDDDTVIAHYRFARELFRRYDDVHGEANVSTNLGVTLRRRGDPSGARRAARRALEGYRTVGDAHREAIVSVNLGAVAEQLGETETARERYRHAERLADRSGSVPHRGFALSGLGSVALREHALEEAERLFRDALGVFEGIDADHRTARVLTKLAEVAVERGDAGEAERRLARVDELLDDYAGRKHTADLLRVRGMACRLRGDLTAAEDALTAGIEDADAGGFRYLHAELLVELARVDADRGNVTTAVDRLVTALKEGIEYECEPVLEDAADVLASLVVDRRPAADEGRERERVRVAVETVAAGVELAPDTCRELAARWWDDGSVDDDSAAAGRSTSESPTSGRLGRPDGSRQAGRR